MLPAMDVITLRLADASDASALERLAQLDSRPLSPGPHLIALRKGRIDAALSLSTREVIANPFQRTVELCDLLRCRAGSIRVGRAELHTPVARPRPAMVATT
jgi:hypothetical protein